MLSPISDLKAADEMPPAIRQQGDTAQTLESFLIYLAEFEDDKGEWMDPMSLEENTDNAGVPNE